MIDGVGAQLEVPRFVPVHLAQPVLGTVHGQPRHASGMPDVDRVSRDVGGGVGGRDPSGSFGS